MRKKWYFIAPLAILAMVLFAWIGGQLVMRLWNWLLPPLFGWHLITFWQAIGLLLLCRILFGGLGVRGSHRSEMRHRIAGRMAERWGHMTPEEREKAGERFRAFCGPSDPASAKPGS
ncbi:MAG TPA: hypothetical protein VJN42_10580 [Candidatus Acidoferrum sp.]|nr:hypothetical protein [Candidatus Acidoferrum sp.]